MVKKIIYTVEATIEVTVREDTGERERKRTVKRLADRVSGNTTYTGDEDYVFKTGKVKRK